MAAICYRVSNDHRLPLYWAYSNGWELHTPDEDDQRYYWVDERANGAQVWSDLASVVLASYWHGDGEYGPANYDLLLVIDTPRVKSCEPWDVIIEATAVRSVSLQAIHDWLASKGVEDRETAESWIESHESELAAWINENATAHKVEWYDSLPCPRKVKHVAANGKKSTKTYPTQEELGA